MKIMFKDRRETAMKEEFMMEEQEDEVLTVQVGYQRCDYGPGLWFGFLYSKTLQLLVMKFS